MLSVPAHQFYLWVSHILENSVQSQKRDIISTRIFFSKNTHIYLYKNLGNVKPNDLNAKQKIKPDSSRGVYSSRNICRLHHEIN